MYSKGKGKANGKDKDKGPGPKQGHTLPRTRITAEKFSGLVTAWKGKYGWIKPSEEVDHEKAKLRNGSLFASTNDVEDGSGELHPGAPCEFHIWEDDSGLGAEEIVETGPPDPAAIPRDDKGKGGFKGDKDKGKAFGAPAAAGAWGAKGGYGKAPAKAPMTKGGSWSEPYGGKGGGYGGGKDAWGGGGKDYGKGAWGGGKDYGKDAWGGGGYGKGKDSWGKGKDAGKGKDDKGKGKKSKEGGKGHLLPRTRVTADKFQGTVSAWKGKYGWITPSEEIEHEKAKARKGGLFVSISDLEGGLTSLTEGATVEFHICEDDSGLGAEEVVQL